LLSQIARATCRTQKTIELNWDVTWVSAAPDGFTRPVIGINGQWPCPTIEVNVGDRIIIHVTNKLGNESTSIHFHGQLQVGSTTMDGPSGVTQCPIPPGGVFTYDFIVSFSKMNVGRFTTRFIADLHRQIQLAVIGITVIIKGSIQMAFVVLSLSKIRARAILIDIFMTTHLP
jgi:Multicopper oxidase